MLITPQLSYDPFSNAAVKDLIVDIDRRMACMAVDKLNYLRFAVDSNVDVQLYEELSLHRDILNTILTGCNCLGNYNIKSIVSSIKILLNKIC